MTRGRLIAIGLCGGVLCGSAWAAVTASVDRTQLAPGDTVELTLQSDHGGSGAPDLTPLARDFEIVARSNGNRLQIVNGSVSSQREVRLTLAPRRRGLVEVPRLTWDGELSAAVGLSVAAANGSAAGDAAAGSVAHVFFTTTLDALQPHVLSAVSLRLRLYSDKPLFQASVDFPGTTDLLVRRIGADETTQESRNGRTYQVITRHYMLVPQRSGEIEIDGPLLNAQVADGSRSLDPFMDRVFGQLRIDSGASGTRALRLRGDPVRLLAQPRPPDLGGDWLPAQQLTLDEVWQPAGGAIAVGAPVTRHLRLSAVGLSASQLPDLGSRMPLPAGLTAHPDAAKLDDAVQDGHIVGRREQDIVMLADRAGRLELPALRVDWWDALTHQRRVAELPARTLEVRPDANAAATPGAAAIGATAAATAAAAPSPVASSVPAADSKTTSASVGTGLARWTWIGVALGLLGLATLAVRVGARRRRPAGAGADADTVARPAAARRLTAAAARQAFQRACREHAARPARDALLAWARSGEPAAEPAGLNALARRLGRAEVTVLLRELDRACLDGTGWNGSALARALPSLDHAGGHRAEAPSPLPGLYSEPPA